MAVTWGGWTSGYSNNARVGIEVGVNGTTVSVNYYVEFQYSVNDAQTLNRGGAIGGSVGYTKNGPNAQLVNSASFNGSLGQNYEISASISGAYNGASPSVGVWVNIPAQPPGPPSWKPTPSNITATSVRLSWGATTAENGSAPYADQLLVRRVSDGVDVHNSTQGGNVRDVSGLTRYTTYQGIARIWNGAGVSDWLWGDPFTTLATVPGTENAPIVSEITSSSAKFTYNGNSDSGGPGITANQLQVATNSSFSNLVYDQVTANNTTVSGLSAAMTYYARVRAQNSVGWSAWGNVAQFTTSATVPGQVGGLSASGITQSAASLSWAAPASGGSTITSYQVQIATNAAFSTGLQTFTPSALSQALSGLVPGTLYYVRVRAVNGVGSGAYSSTLQFTTISGKPVIVSATGLEYPNRASGYAGAQVSAVGWSGNFTITVQIAAANTFATILKTLTVTPSAVSANQQYALQDTALQLNGTYYVRAKVKNNTTAYESDWSDVVTYTQSHTPTATPLSPTSDVTVAYAATTDLTFRFADGANGGAPSDQMSAYQIVVENNTSGAVVLDTGKVAKVTTGFNPQVTHQAAFLAAQKNVALRWRVRVWDSLDQASVYSSYSIFTLADPPVVALVQPPDGAPVTSGNPLFSWTLTIPSGGTQSSTTLTVQEQSTGSTAWSVTLPGVVLQAQSAYVVLQNGKTYTATLSITDSRGLVGTAQRTFTVTYISPPSVDFEIIAQSTFVAENGYILLDWSATSPDPEIVSWAVYRKLLPSGQWVLLKEVFEVETTQYRDWTALGNESYQYSVTQRANRSGVVLESPVGFYRPNSAITDVNYAMNPQITSATRGATYATGTGEVGTTTYETGKTDGPLSQITSYMRRATTTAKTASSSTGPGATSAAQRSLVDGVAGDVITLSLWVRYTGVGSVNPRLRVVTYTSAGVTVSSQDTTYQIVQGDGQWVRISGSVTASGDFAQVGWWAYQTGTDGPAAGSTYDVTGVLIEKNVPEVGTYFDGDTPSTFEYNFSWTGTAGASTSTRSAAARPEDRFVPIQYTNYWLISPDDETQNMRLGSVKEDTFTEEYEKSSTHILNRGRHVDYGDRIGYTGTLTLSLRGADARARRLAIQAARSKNRRWMMRTPFGDLFPVALGDPSISRTPSTGNVEMSDVTLPYEEVY